MPSVSARIRQVCLLLFAGQSQNIFKFDVVSWARKGSIIQVCTYYPLRKNQMFAKGNDVKDSFQWFRKLAARPSNTGNDDHENLRAWHHWKHLPSCATSRTGVETTLAQIPVD